jgi:hypothetical protein
MKRSAILSRSTPLRRDSGEARLSVKVARGKCKVCREPFVKRRPIQPACSPVCEAKFALAKVEKARAKYAAEDKRATRAALEALKGVPQLKKEAQQAFNQFIRARDRAAGHPCISSGRPLDWSGNMTDAGHYRSTGAADHLRFNEDNCHAQTKHENRDKAGNAVEYRIRLIARIGLARVEALECDNAPVKWTRDGLREIRDLYRAKARAIAKENS